MALSVDAKRAERERAKRLKSIMEHPDYELRVKVASRLRAIMAEFGYHTYIMFGEACGVDPGSINNWVNPRNKGSLPRVPTMITLCEKTGLTLDWIYRGQSIGMDGRLAVRLEDRIKHNDVKQKVIRSY